MIILALIGLVVLVLIVIVAWLRSFVKTHGAATIAARFLTGRHLDGRYRTDAGPFRRGVRVLHPTGHASRWAHLSHAERAGLRLTSVAAGAAVCGGLATDPAATVAALAATAAVALIGLVVLAVRKVRELSHTRRYVRPLHRALAPVIGVPLATRPGSWLTVPRDYARADGARISLALPEDFLATADAKRAIMTAIGDKLAIEDSRVEWRTVGKSPAAIITMSAPPPGMAAFGQLRPQIEAAPASAPVIGTGRNRAVVSADFDADSPHVLVSAGSGGGKSTIVRGLLSQGLHKGAVGIVCDIKRISHAWARGMPNVIYARGIAEIHNVLIAVKAEVDRRNELVDELADDNGDLPAEAEAEIGPRIELVMEEMNATANRLAAHWRKTKDKNDPAVSPAVEALGDILFMGRAVRVNVIAVAQMMTAKTLGGPEARENFATRIMARYTVNAWKMLVPEVWPMPRSSRHRGRVQVVIAGTAQETQVVYFTTAEAREWGLSGTVSQVMLPESAAVVPVSHAPAMRAADQGNGAGTVPALPAPVTLREACDRGILTASLESARAARKRDPDFPAVAGIQDGAMAYDPGALAQWERNRPRAFQAEECAAGAQE
jgi:hypothetical protein